MLAAHKSAFGAALENHRTAALSRSIQGGNDPPETSCREAVILTSIRHTQELSSLTRTFVPAHS
jgi:hypothetical protein